MFYLFVNFKELSTKITLMSFFSYLSGKKHNWITILLNLSIIAKAIFQQKGIIMQFYILLALILFRIDFLFTLFVNFYSAHAQNKDTQGIFNSCKGSCPVRKVDKSKYFFIFTLFSLLIFCNNGNSITIKCDSMPRISNHIDTIRILSVSIACLEHFL